MLSGHFERMGERTLADLYPSLEQAESWNLLQSTTANGNKDQTLSQTNDQTMVERGTNRLEGRPLKEKII